jgi:hypothetical protein
MTLSYCWGGEAEHHFKTTKEHYDGFKRGIDYASLPLTHREAILTTLFLGVRFLWIDSMCIIQDDAHDWEAEAARMSSVYANSLLTLAATSSSGPQEGLLNPYQSGFHTVLDGDKVMLRMETHQTIDTPSAPLNTRGWTLQETVLSPRSVCFGKDQWLWRCASRHATEDGFVDEDSSHGGGGFGLIQMASIAREGAGADGRAYFRHWYALAANYSRRGLTFRRDKLGAIAGLAGAFTKHTGCTYVAGLWAEDIAVGLMWNATSRGVTREAGAIPSWSWTSVDGEVMPPHLRGPSVSAPLLTLASIEQQWDGVPLSSRLLVAQLTVEGSLIQATLGQQSMTQKLRHHLTTGPGSEPESEEIIGEAFLDSSLAADGQPISVWCLRAFSVLASDGKPENYVLLLVPAQQEEQQDSDGGPRAYQRLGTGVIWEKGRRATSEASEGRDTFAEARTARVVLV